MQKHKGIRRSKSDRVFDVCNVVLMTLCALIMLYPLYFVAIASFSDPSAVSGGRVYFSVVDFSLQAYKSILKETQIWIGYRNTLLYTLLGTFYNLALTIPAAYVLSKRNIPLHGFISWFFFLTMYFSGGMIPSYLLIKGMGLLDSPLVMILGAGVSCYNLIVTRQFFSTSIPEALYESATIDGANDYRCFFSIAIPSSGPIIAVMALYYAVGHWNAYYNALLYIRSRSLYPLQLVLRNILINEESTSLVEDVMASEDAIKAQLERVYLSYAMKYALIFIAAVPMLIAYPFVQRFFVKGIMVGSVKG
ncbi:MAG: carbohydrate ABC transporter permease [Eubacteriales bacterium]|nr:carbohydrate ABC transporter permease [Eubacteriales bacterium]